MTDPAKILIRQKEEENKVIPMTIFDWLLVFAVFVVMFSLIKKIFQG
jgi:hypothetical protein